MDDHEAIRSLQALAHPSRLAVFRLLVREGTAGLPAGAIAKAVGMTATATSFHLKELDRAGLVFATRDGRFVRYAIEIDAMRALLTFLTEDCCEGRPELCGGDLAAAGTICDAPAKPAKKSGRASTGRRPGSQSRSSVRSRNTSPSQKVE